MLVIDDDAAVCSLIRNMLRRHGVTSIVEANNGEQALQMFQATPMSFDFIICDWNMTGMSGTDLCRQVRAARPVLPFLMATGRSDVASVVSAKGSGVSAYVVKPFSMNELTTKIAQLVQNLPQSKT